MGQQTSRKTTDNRNDLTAAVQRARAVLPGDPAFGDPLSVSGPGAPAAMARVVAGGPHGIAREIGLSALQVWQAALGRSRGNQEMTILFTDLVAFSKWSLEAGDEKTLHLLRQVAAAIEPPVTANGGRVVKRMGDGMMAVFPSAGGAVRAALTGRAALAQIELDGYRPTMRMGLHTGTPREIGGDWLGVDVNIAARMMEAGGNGNTILSQATVEAAGVGVSPGLGTRAHRATPQLRPLDGVPEDLEIFYLADEISALRSAREDAGAGLCVIL